MTKSKTMVTIDFDLFFVLCLYKFKFGLPTEGLLQLLEKYIVQMEYLDSFTDETKPFAEG